MATALLRHSTSCAQCGTALISPEWSESAGDRKTIHIWHCLVCGHEFETMDDVPDQKPSEAELVQEFLPNLLVA
jgi:ribosomal protein L37AE/L43A